MAIVNHDINSYPPYEENTTKPASPNRVQNPDKPWEFLPENPVQNQQNYQQNYQQNPQNSPQNYQQNPVQQTNQPQSYDMNVLIQRWHEAVRLRDNYIAEKKERTAQLKRLLADTKEELTEIKNKTTKYKLDVDLIRSEIMKAKKVS